jgi:hypothetical protein
MKVPNMLKSVCLGQMFVAFSRQALSMRRMSRNRKSMPDRDVTRDVWARYFIMRQAFYLPYSLHVLRSTF